MSVRVILLPGDQYSCGPCVTPLTLSLQLSFNPNTFFGDSTTFHSHVLTFDISRGGWYYSDPSEDNYHVRKFTPAGAFIFPVFPTAPYNWTQISLNCDPFIATFRTVYIPSDHGNPPFFVTATITE